MFAATDAAALLEVGGAAATAAFVAAAAYPFVESATAPREDEHLDPAERRRRAALRADFAAYRWFEPMVDRLAARLGERVPAFADRLQRDLELVEPERQWRSGEFFAIKRFESGLMFPAAAAFGYVLLGPALGILLGLLVAAAYPYLQANGVSGRARKYRDRLQARLPLIADLLALMLEGGSTLPEAVEMTADENRGHPIGEELARVVAAVARGEKEADALRGMAARVESPDLTELVMMVNSATERGVPLKDALREMAERLRVRRVQRLERSAEEAKVKISGPGLLVMLACLAIITAPFLLSAMVAGR